MFLNIGSCGTSNWRLDDEQKRMQVKFSLYSQIGDHGVRSKGQISLNFSDKVNFKDFYTKLCLCSHK